MEANFQPEAPDRTAAVAAAEEEEEGCRNELTRSSSSSSSDSKDFRPRSTNARACMEWTDEKHSLYLDALEASFVKQLHHLFRSEGMPLRGKRIFSNGLSSLGRHCVRYKCHQDAVSSTAGDYELNFLDAVSTTAEVSDQNFEDENQEEKPSRLSRTKRLKVALIDSSTADQIVSSGNVFTAETLSASDTLSE